MKNIKRQQKILEKLYAQKSVSIDQLSEEHNVSKITIRRDLQKFYEAGISKKTYGGAILIDSVKDVPIFFREVSHSEEKIQICKTASKLIKNGDTIILFYSSTTSPLIPLLRDFTNLTVITNSPNAIQELSKFPDMNILCTGGLLKKDAMTYVGEAASAMLKKYYADRLFFSTGGISLERELTDSSESNSAMIKLAIQSAKNVTYLADASKFNNISFYHIDQINTINTVVTNQSPGVEWEQHFANAKIELFF